VPSNFDDRRQSPRVDANLQARLDFSVLLREADSTSGGVQHLRAVAGHTVNVSAGGLAVVLHAQNIDEQYLTSDSSAIRETRRGLPDWGAHQRNERAQS
jgi:hypothetical protein